MPLDEPLRRAIYDQIAPYGNFLQRRRVPEGSQGLNLEPGLWLLAGVVIADFCRGFFSTLGGELSKKVLAVFGAARPKPTEVVHDADAQLRQLIEALSEYGSFPDSVSASEAGRLEVEITLTQSGLPTYRAKEASRGVVRIILQRLQSHR